MKEKALTGGDNPEKHLIGSLRVSMKEAQSIDLIVSFLMESGVRILSEELKDAVKRHVPIRILTGNYLGITQPSALYLLRDAFHDDVEIHFYNEKGRSFHAKSYMFHYETYNEIYVGSSNLSRSALTSGIEWNYRFTDREDRESYNGFYRAFEDLYENHSVNLDDDELSRYAAGWHRPHVYHDLDMYDHDSELRPGSASVYQPLLHPRGPQIEALYNLEEIRKDGAACALVQAATGIGKTYLAAFDSVPFKRVLFAAHRREILEQAADSFHKVRPHDTWGFFEGQRHDRESDMIFASVETLGKKEYLQQFKKDDFDYIVIDEFHHAAAGMYRNILDYFTPKFLLGLTATPERMDGRSIYELLDYNVAYELPLASAINQGYLVPFHYYGIYDSTDYDNMKFQNGKYRTEDLEKAYIGNRRRYDLILGSYKKYPSERALAFCVSKKHAEDMSRYFNENGVSAAAVYSGTPGKYAMARDEALNQLKEGKLKVLFSIDMFNEGLDVPDIDLVMFLRPTESPTVFLQQLGRGLRKADGKAYLTVLDFIGNYARASKIPGLLTGRQGMGGSVTPQQYPDDCIVDFDLRLLDLFKKMEERSLTMKKRIRNEMERIREQIGHVPSRLECFACMDDEIFEYCWKNAGNNPFRDYLKYLHELGWLNAEEEKLYQDRRASSFIRYLEQTSMSKVYKMPVLMTFMHEGKLKPAVTAEETLQSWKKFFSTGTNWKDLVPDGKYEDYLKITDSRHLSNIVKNPVRFLLKSGSEYFCQPEGYLLALQPDLQRWTDNPVFVSQFEDAVLWRAKNYYRTRYLLKQEKTAA